MKQLVDILWSDPIRLNEKTGKIIPHGLKKMTGCYFNKSRNFGSLFGTDVSEKFCKKYNFNYIIRSHECRDKGFSQDHPKCFTLFSASCYLNSTNMGAVILVTPNDKKFQVYAYSNLINNTNNNDDGDKNNSLLIKFKHLIQLNHFNLIPKYEKLDLNETGMIDQHEWASVLSNEFEISIEHLLLIKDFLCECDHTHVYYKTMFKTTTFNLNNTHTNSTLESENYLMLVKSLFEIIDKNHDNHISLDEAKEALFLISKRNSKYEANEEECLKFIKKFDINCDNLIDLNEFNKAFFYDEFALSLNNLRLNSSESESISSTESSSSLVSHLNDDDYDDDNDIISDDIHIVRI